MFQVEAVLVGLWPQSEQCNRAASTVTHVGHVQQEKEINFSGFISQRFGGGLITEQARLL